jgi:transcriptional regulator with XRE-family HTH domain
MKILKTPLQNQEDEIGGDEGMTLKELRKSKGLTMGKLAELSGVSAKTISLYEQSPPARPSKKALSKISSALGISPEDLRATLFPEKRRAKGRPAGIPEENIMLDESHVTRLLRLLDKEIEELRYLMVDCANLAEEHPAMNMCLDAVSADIDLLTQIKGRFQA